jgi:DNA-binding CsgD family transcriptional regulator/predicted ATPase
MQGCEREWEIVAGVFSRARQGQGGVLLVEGEPGMGKSLLLAQAAREAAGHGFTVLSAAEQPGSLVPLAPLFAAIGESPTAWTGELGAQGPEIRICLAEWLRMRLEELAGAAPVLVALDDLQGADLGTLSAVRTLSCELASYPVAWLLTRSGGEDPSAAQQLFALLHEEGATRIRLGLLSDGAVFDLAAEALGAVPDTELLTLAAGAGGNPFLVAELLAGLRDENAVRIADAHATPRKPGARRRHRAHAERPLTGWARLTDTERTISLLVSQGLTNRQIADQMFISVHTVVFCLRQVIRELGIGSRAELARIAIEQQRET